MTDGAIGDAVPVALASAAVRTGGVSAAPTPPALAARLIPLQIAVGLQGLLLWVPVEKLFMTQIGFDAASWQMVVAPAATPKDIVERLHTEIKEFTRQAEIRDHASSMGVLPIDTPSVASLQVFVQAEIARWGKVVEQAGIAGSQ